MPTDDHVEYLVAKYGHRQETRMSPPDGKFPGDDAEIPTILDASEFRDIDLTGTQRTTDFSSLDNESMQAPTHVQPRVARAALTNDGREIQPYDIVQPVAARSYDSYSSVVNGGTVAYPGDAMRLAGDDPERLRILISVTGTGTVLLGPIGSVSNGAGFALTPGLIFETRVQGAIYACTPVGQTDPMSVHVWIERGL